MKILFISHEDSKFGAPKSLMELIYTLKKNYDVEPIVLLHSEDNVFNFCEKEEIEKHITRHRNITCGRKEKLSSYLKIIPKNLVNRYDDIRALNYIKKNVDMSSIDLIHSNVTITSLGMLLSKTYNIPHIVHLRETASNVENFVHTRNYVDFLNNGADYFIAISKFNSCEWIKRGLDINKIKVIYNGLNLSYIGNKKSNYNDKIKIVFSGAISPDKGQLILIEALNLIPSEIKENILVDIIGDGDVEYISVVQNKIKKYNLDKIVCLKGYIENVSETFCNYDIGIIASKEEAFGRVTVEYMANGLCVIASNTGANPELIVDGFNGFLFEREKIIELSNKIKYIISSKNKIKECAINAKKVAFEKYTTEINAKNIYNLYKHIKDNLS